MRLAKLSALILTVFFVTGCYLNTSIVVSGALTSSVVSSPNESIPSAPAVPAPTPDPVPVPTVGPGPVASLSVPSFLKVNKMYTFDISLSAPHDQDITINYETQDGTAVSPLNYIATSSSIVIPAGNTTGQISIRTTDKFDDLGTFKDFILKLTSTTAGTLDQPVKTINVGMHVATGIVDLVKLAFMDSERCLVTNSNKVQCWNGQNSRSPKTNNVIGTSFSKLSVGSTLKCILTSLGGVKCVGSNYYGQLGDGTNTDSLDALVDVIGLSSGVSAISVGGSHACALLSNGTVSCWGYNAAGQLGNNSTTPSATPAVISGLNNVVKITSGVNYTCAILNTGEMKCWGQNTERQIGDNTTVNKLVPTTVSGLTSGVLEMSAGAWHTCALMTTNLVKCWGTNTYGQLGDNTTTHRAVPADVVSLSNVSSLNVGPNHTCAGLIDGSVKCWGYNGGGQLGDGTVNNSATAVSVVGLPNLATKAYAGENVSCALLADTKLYCWGLNGYSSEMGDGQVSSTAKYPKAVSTLGTSVAQAAKGRQHTCIVTTAGAVKCWGYNYFAQLGDGTNKTRYEPVAVSGLSSGIAKVSAGTSHSCSLSTTGAVKCWGGSGYGEVGDGTNSQRSTPVSALGLSSGVTDIASGRYHACALLSTGGVKCWGDNSYGQVGDGTFSNRSTPTDVSGLTSGVLSISVGKSLSCAVITGGIVKCWGHNSYGQLGNGTTTNSNIPVTVTGLTSVTKVSAGEHSTCAILAGGVKCWGSNWNGELGDDTWNDSSTPVDVLGLQSGVTDIMASGEDYSSYGCARLNTGILKCWGDSSYSQIVGADTSTSFGKPVDVVGLSSAVTSIVQGYSATNCIINTNSELVCWGFNENNQARGVYNYAPQPVLIGDEDL